MNERSKKGMDTAEEEATSEASVERNTEVEPTQNRTDEESKQKKRDCLTDPEEGEKERDIPSGKSPCAC